MNKFIFGIMLTTVLFGCSRVRDPKEVDLGIDQCTRQEQMLRCLSTTPAGPQSTNQSDWADVVKNCGNDAYYSSIRNKNIIKAECLAPL